MVKTAASIRWAVLDIHSYLHNKLAISSMLTNSRVLLHLQHNVPCVWIICTG